jgi:hypothetical protein
VVKSLYTNRSSKELFWHQVSPTDFHEDVKPSGTGKQNSINIDNRGKNTKGRKDKCCYPDYGISGHRPESSTCASLHTLSYFLAEPTRTPDAILVSGYDEERAGIFHPSCFQDMEGNVYL